MWVFFVRSLSVEGFESARARRTGARRPFGGCVFGCGFGELGWQGDQ